MAKQLNVNLAFTADTGQAKAQLQDLQKSLDSLIKGSASNTKLPLTKELVEAQNAATSLKVALNSAVNIQTGKLDITKFSTAMKSAGLDATQLRKQLETLGPGGSQAFLSLTKSVMSAEMPIRRTNALVAEMWTTLKNTARWQISSSVLHGFMGTMQQAYGYAKDLDESLNNIRIVTNANTEEMARFAENANKAAKALSTTTTAYTNAALIYYQQGNDDQTVLEKTDVTAKMANVTGQSAQVVSEQLTAIWNNFNKEGDKSYEHFADVLTALGAATASSTDEIAGGLEKFAGIADTIGLSYEYAASALATITATSRESEDVVGTALKTIFARIQGLNLGETLDDGTTLNKYSEALSKVGISIFEQNGELKNMDAILAEMGNKWDTLNKDQQMALAQAVAGTRQYNQMMTLMDNWDFMESNLEIARESDGELERQADVYAESWEAARSRVKAASEDLFDSILDEKFFISIANSLEKVIDLSARFVDSLGGLPGVLATVGTLVTKIFSKQLEASIDNMIYGINSLTGVNMKTNKDTKESYAKEAEKISVNDASHEGEALSTGMQQQINLQKELIANEAKLSQEEKARVAHLMDIHQLYVDQAAAAGKVADENRKIIQEQNKNARTKIKRSDSGQSSQEFVAQRKAMSDTIALGVKAQKTVQALGNNFDKIKNSPEAFNKQISLIQERLQSIGSDTGSTKAFNDLVTQWRNGEISAEEFKLKIQELAQSNEVLDDAVIQSSNNLQQWGKASGLTVQETDAMANAELELQQSVEGANNALRAQEQQAQNIKNVIAGAKGAIDTLATSIVKTMQGISQIGMAITSFVSIFDVLNNEDMSFGEKLLSITMSLSMALPALIGGIKTLTAVKWANYAASAKDLAISGARLALIGLEKVGLLGLIGAKSGETAATLGAAAANLTWQATALPILAITLAIVAAIAALVAIAWVLVSVFNAIKASTPEGKLAAAKKEAEELGSVLESTKQAAEELKTAFEGYDSAVDKLEQCTEGTLEWKNALRDVNNEVLGLLSSYPELSTMVNEKGEKAVDYGKDGELKIADWAREEMEAKANQSVLNAQTASTKANQKVRQAEQDILTRDTASNINQQKGTTATKNVSGQGYDVSGEVSSYIAKHAAELSSMTQEKQQEFLQDYFQSNGIIADSSAWVNAIQNLGTDLGELAATVEANTAATQLENEILTSQMLQDNDKVNASQYKDDIIKASSVGLDEKINAEVQALKNSGWGTSGISKADGVNDEARKIFAEYAEAAGISNYDLTDTTGTDDNRNFVYTDSEGEEVTVSLEAMRQVVAAANASTKVAENAGALVESFAGKAEGEVAAMMATLTKDVKDLTVDQASGKFDVEEFANSLTEKDLKAMGYEGDLETMRADYIAAYNDIAAEGSEALASIVDDYTQSVQNSMNSLIESGSLGELSLEQVDALGATMEEVFTQGGQSALDNFTNIFESVDMSQRDEFVDALGNIDWQTTSVESLRAALEEAGVETSNFSDGALQSLISTMANGAVTIASATEKYSSLHSIIDGLATGDTISEEQFNQFEQYGIEADNYFTKMADGTYKLIGDAEEFYNAVNNESMEGFKQAITDAQNSIADINNILNVGTGNIGTESYNEYENTYEPNASAGTQLDYLEQTDYDLTQIQEWRKELEEGTLNQKELTEAVLDHTEALGGAEAAEELLRSKLEERNMEMEEGIGIVLSSAQSLDELKSRASDLNASDEAYDTGLLSLASGYENCAEEIKEFNNIAADASDEIKQQKRVALEAAVAIGEMAEEYGLSADEVEDLADEFQNLAKSGKNQYKILGEDGEAAADAAVRYKRLNDSVLDLSENYDDYKEVLKDITDASDDLDKAMIANSANGKKLQSSLAGLLGTSEDLINADLLGAIDPKDFEAAAEGDEAAIQRIRDAFIELQAEANGIDVSGLKEELAGLEEGIVVDINADTMPFLYALIEAQVAAGASATEIENLLSGFNIDATVSDFEGTLAEAVAASEAASAEIIANNSYTQDVKQTTVETPVVDEEIQYDTQYTPHQVDSYDLVLKNGADEPELVHQTRTEWTKSVTPTVVPTTMTEQEVGTEVTTSNAAGDSAPVKGVKIENAHKSSGGKVSNSTKRQAGNNMSGGKKGGGGGGGGKSKPAEKTKKSEIVERYKEFEDQLDDTREEADKLRESLDNLWGDDLAEAAERLIELEERERSLLEQKANEAREHLEEDKKALKEAAKDLDITFTFDAKGNITDYTEEMTALYQELADMETAFGDEWSESEQKQIEALKEKISLLEEAMGDYEETRELLEDINIELDEMAGKAVLPEVKSDNFDYFKELNDELDDVEDALEKAQRNYERATSIEDKTKYLQEILTLEQQRLLIMEDQKARAEQVVAEQKLALEQLAELEGIEFEYDKNGNITNYDETIGAMWDEYYELRDSYMDEAGKISPDEQAILDAMKSNIEDLTQYVDDYSEAVEQLEDSVIALDEALGDLPDPYVKADHMDIYKENRDQIDDIEEEIDDARRKADKLTGDARIAALKEVAKLEEKRIQLLKEQKAIAESEIKERKEAMQEIAERNGAVMAIDENGNVTNYIEVMDALLENYEYLANGGDDGLINEAEEIAMEALEKDIKELQEYIDAYCDAVETAEDIQNEIEESAEGGYIDISNLDETIDKLHDINNTLDEIQDALDDSSKAADRLYGSARISQMQKTADLLQKEIGALERKAELQKEIIADEREELNTKASEMGTQFTYDDRGNITNYRAVLKAEKAQIEDMKARLEADGNFSPEDEDLIQGMVDNYEDLADAVEEYEQALEDAEDIQNEIQDAFYEWQDLNAEMLSYELELKLQVNDRELAKIERAINRISDDFYQRAEAAAMMIGGGAGGSSQYSTYISRLNELESQYNKVHQAYLAGEISQAAYVEQTRAIEAEIENVNASLESLQDTMDDYYKNTLSAARQELKFYTDQLSHLTGVLNHFKSILQALGKQNDYEMMDRVLRGQVETLENEVQAQKEAMALWKSQADQLYADYERELAAGNTENANMYYQAYQEALNAANEAENQYYAKAQQWANALKALMQNTLSDLAQDLENSLTGGTSFDTINTQLKRASSLQEEYLTTTNKIYETTKLMRTAQNEIDKTTNSVAKQKFANFINETKQLQNQNKLSKYELSIQQAKYDLLVAEIALEEARFAKSTVRLQRDSEGNFGYVYTANAEAVANAEQKFEDASNKLYNLALEGANKYVEKYQQTLSEMYDTLTSLQKKYLDGGFESEEEYNRAVLEAKEYYYAKLQDYSSLYQVAITTDSAVIADAWSTDFADMTEKTDQWMQSVNSYLDEVVIAFQEWERESDRIANETIGKDLDALEQNVKDITDRSEELVTQITDPANGVIKAISDELAAVKALTDQYASLRGEIVGTIQANDALIESMEKDIQASEEAEKGKQEDVTDPTIEENDWAPEQSNDDLDDTTTEDTGGTDPEPPTDDGGSNEEEGKVPDPTPLCSHESGTTTETIKATCTTAGSKITKCAKCGEVIREEPIAKLGHDKSGSWQYDKKNHWKECKRSGCGAVIEKDAHTLKNGECTVCHYKPDSKSNKVIEVGDTPIYKSGKYYHDSYGTSPAGTRGQGKKVKVTQVIKNPKSGQDYPIHVESSDSAYGWLKASQLEGYDTGGYTGSWGSSGKLAMLHEKEIILNKDDTRNFLASLELLDNILSTIDLYATNSQFNTLINSPSVGAIGKDTLEQKVSIEASFPNATDKVEIEEAFKNLVNLASQYANRK